MDFSRANSLVSNIYLFITPLTAKKAPEIGRKRKRIHYQGRGEK
jgi:hypothetical protein